MSKITPEYTKDSFVTKLRGFLAEERLVAGSNTALARETGLSLPTISDFLAGNRVNGTTIDAICRAYGISPIRLNAKPGQSKHIASFSDIQEPVDHDALLDILDERERVAGLLAENLRLREELGKYTKFVSTIRGELRSQITRGVRNASR